MAVEGPLFGHATDRSQKLVTDACAIAESDPLTK
jgi:hypothetical protein